MKNRTFLVKALSISSLLSVAKAAESGRTAEQPTRSIVRLIPLSTWANAIIQGNPNCPPRMYLKADLDPGQESNHEAQVVEESFLTALVSPYVLNKYNKPTLKKYGWIMTRKDFEEARRAIPILLSRHPSILNEVLYTWTNVKYSEVTQRSDLIQYQCQMQVPKNMDFFRERALGLVKDRFNQLNAPQTNKATKSLLKYNRKLAYFICALAEGPVVRTEEPPPQLSSPIR